MIFLSMRSLTRNSVVPALIIRCISTASRTTARTPGVSLPLLGLIAFTAQRS